MKKYWIWILTALIFGLGIFAIYRYYPAHLIESKEFDGNLMTVKNKSILVKGAPFSVDPKSVGIDPNNLPVVEVAVTSDTKIVRTTFQIPLADELKKTNGMFEPDKLPRQQAIASFDTLKKDFSGTQYTIGMKIISLKNVVGKQQIVAQEIDYIFPTHNR